MRKGNGSGFLDSVYVDADGQGFGEDDLMAVAPADGRGSFLDLVNDAGPDASKAFVRRTTMERGSGPLHAIIRVDGEYRYSKPGHAPAPFVTRIHAYAGRSYITVDHTFVFTGDPDKHKKAEGEHEHIATQTEKIIPEIANDPGWMQPNDRLSAAGLAVELKAAPGVKLRATSAMGAGRWWEDKDAAPIDAAVEKSSALLQTGPKPNRIPPVPESSATARLEQGFEAALTVDGRQVANGERAPGWMVIGDGTREIAIAMPRFLEEYPKEIRYEAGRATAFFWSPAVEPMSFARFSSELDREEETVAIENNAQGLAKTSEVIFDFRRTDAGAAVVRARRGAARAPLNAFRHPPVVHADPSWYGQSGVFGKFAARTRALSGISARARLQVRVDAVQSALGAVVRHVGLRRLEAVFRRQRWIQWGNNEPAGDFTNWMQFMRTGDPRVYDAARANSRHSMDVDNVHWPADPVWLGDTQRRARLPATS